ncbi:MAG: DUF1622 domain-containing protein [Aquihabitans sp.]
MDFIDIIETVGKAVDAAGVAVIVVGALGAAAVTWSQRATHGDDLYRTYRRRLGRAILLGLELLVAADIIRTVAVRPTFTSAGVLGIIVLIRTFLSMSLEIELEGRWPWQHRPGEAVKAAH